MKQVQPSRREFVRTAAVAAAGVAGFAANGALGAESKEQSGAAAKKSGWVVACRESHLKDTDQPDSWSAMRVVGVDGVEVNVELDGTCASLYGADRYSIADADQVKRLGETFEKNGKVISAFCMMNRFDERPDEELRSATMIAQAAAKLGVPAIRIDVVPRKIKSEDEFLKFAVQMGKKLIEATSDLSVRFGVENHGGTTNRPEFMLKLLEEVGSKRFGQTLDLGNCYWFGPPLSKLYDVYAGFAPHACHTHCKSIRYPEADRDRQRPVGWQYGKYCCPIYEGDIDYRKVAEILHKAGYQGDLCIENESLGRFPKEQRLEVLKKEASLLRDLCKPA